MALDKNRGAARERGKKAARIVLRLVIAFALLMCFGLNAVCLLLLELPEIEYGYALRNRIATVSAWCTGAFLSWNLVFALCGSRLRLKWTKYVFLTLLLLAIVFYKPFLRYGVAWTNTELMFGLSVFVLYLICLAEVLLLERIYAKDPHRLEIRHGHIAFDLMILVSLRGFFDYDADAARRILACALSIGHFVLLWSGKCRIGPDAQLLSQMPPAEQRKERGKAAARFGLRILILLTLLGCYVCFDWISSEPVCNRACLYLAGGAAAALSWNLIFSLCGLRIGTRWTKLVLPVFLLYELLLVFLPFAWGEYWRADDVEWRIVIPLLVHTVLCIGEFLLLERIYAKSGNAFSHWHLVFDGIVFVALLAGVLLCQNRKNVFAGTAFLPVLFTVLCALSVGHLLVLLRRGLVRPSASPTS